MRGGTKGKTISYMHPNYMDILKPVQSLIVLCLSVMLSI